MNTIHLVDGEKGGVGKSVVAQAMFYFCLKCLLLSGKNKLFTLDELNQKISFFKQNQKSLLRSENEVLESDIYSKYPHIPLVLIDADRSNPDVKNVYSGKFQDLIIEGFFSENSKEKSASHTIFEAAVGKIAIINVPSSAKRAIDSWLNINDLFGLAEMMSEPIKFTKWFVTNGQKDSLNLFVDSVDEYGGKMTHLLVPNNYFCDDWSLLNNPPYSDALKKSSILNFPALDEDYATAIRNGKLDYDDAIAGAGFFRNKLIARHAIFGFVNKFSTAFEETKQFDSLIKLGSELTNTNIVSKTKNAEAATK
ncbi:MAG: hypothetical protein SWX82_32675 [Cyanobacteriota bacterium]|nr:hypothetical protein [Cyanobacteriota bacterium]